MIAVIICITVVAIGLVAYAIYWFFTHENSQ